MGAKQRPGGFQMRSSISIGAALGPALGPALGLALAACGQPAPSSADAQAQAATPPNAASATATATATAIAADRTAILNAIHAGPDASGQVANACDEKVMPQFIAIDLGGAVGAAQLVIIPGGPNSATCYGDGPGDMHVMARNGAGFSEIHAQQGAFLAVLTTRHNGVRDIVFAGPGMSHPVYQWNGSAYAQHGEIADGAMGDAQIYPQ